LSWTPQGFCLAIKGVMAMVVAEEKKDVKMMMG
jgi:hypothetical protein